MSRLLGLLFVLACVGAANPTFALELGAMTVASRPGQILDAKIILLDTDIAQLQSWYPIPASGKDYQAQGLDYIQPLHGRIVMEIVVMAEPPYIAISSIGPVNRRAFDLLVQISNTQQHTSRHYRLVLKESISFTPPAVKVMTPAETLSYLLAQLASGEVSIQAVLATLKEAVSADENQAGRRHLILRFLSPQLDESFIAGLRAMLSEQHAITFDHIRENTNDAQAVNDILFAQQDFSTLKKLLRLATMSSLSRDAEPNQRLEFMKERIAVLENKLSELEYMLAQQSNTETINQQSIDRRIYAWLVRRQWDDPRLLLTRSVWVGFAAFWVVLLCLFIWRQWRRSALNQPIDRGRQPLPGEVELQKLRDHHARLDLPSEDSAMASELDSATAYIEMGEYDEALARLKKVKKHGSESEIKRANELYEKINQ